MRRSVELFRRLILCPHAVRYVPHSARYVGCTAFRYNIHSLPRSATTYAPFPASGGLHFLLCGSAASGCRAAQQKTSLGATVGGLASDLFSRLFTQSLKPRLGITSW